MAKKPNILTVDALKHDADKRKNIPTAEFQSVLQKSEQTPIRITYERRNRDLDPQLVWRGKDEQDWSDLVVHAPPLYIQEKVHPKALIDDLLRQTREHPSPLGRGAGGEGIGFQTDLFADFNGMAKGADKTEFYAHDQNWSNRMILGDSLQVMASLAEREGLRGRVQCIYLDPPYGIKFNSNFQWSTTSRDVKDGKADHITREPEQVKAFRDTWRDGIHSYLTYLRDRLTVARDLLTESGSIFVQIGEENAHRVRALMEEVFGEDNFVSMIAFATTSAHSTNYLSNTSDYIIFFAKKKEALKFRPLYGIKSVNSEKGDKYRSVLLPDGTQRPLTKDEVAGDEEVPSEARIFTLGDLVSKGWSEIGSAPFSFGKQDYECPGNSHWKTHRTGLVRLGSAGRLEGTGKRLMFRRFIDDFGAFPFNNQWLDTSSGFSLSDPKLYVVQTRPLVVQRCILMATDPGDLVLDPTCGSGTTATVAEQWGRRWITIDTSRVALALARARIMGARYPFYLLADSREGQLKEAEVTRTAPSSQPVQGNIRHGFVYERVPHIMLSSISNNAEIDVIWDQWQVKLEPLREQLNSALKKTWQEWEIPRVAEDPWPAKDQELFYKLRSEQGRENGGSEVKVLEWLQAINHNLKRSYTLDTLPKCPADPWPEAPSKLHADWWQARIARQQEIDKSIAAKAEFEYLYDKPYDDKKKVRVAGPFTVESLSPHRVLGVDEDDELIDTLKEDAAEYGAKQSFPQMILENLKTAGVQQAHKEDRITFTALAPWPGEGRVCAEGRYLEGEVEKRAGIFIGPEFGTVQRADLVEAARECGDAGFDVLIACAFNYEAHATEFSKLGRIPVLKARMNADLHMAEDLKTTNKANLFVIFGEPDITLINEKDGKLRVKVNGVDVFKPQTGEVISDGADGIACWFIDTDYNEESFFVRHAYFLGANDPYSALKTTLKAEINAEAWASLNSDTSRPFQKPKSGRIAVKVINHLGDEVMKVFRV
ncbi:MAG TPA: site-specific DNA-methyltransferase [Dissulfurispiraceae bacterium]|nr:site-specific DNA-methyltransferase [Dissulfurispiraceae bacterium]